MNNVDSIVPTNMNYLLLPGGNFCHLKSKYVLIKKMNEFEINHVNQIYWFFMGKNKLIPKANSIANIEIFIRPSDPLHTVGSQSPLQQVVLQKQILKGWFSSQSGGDGADGLPVSQKRLVYWSPVIGSKVQAVTQVPGPDTPSRFTCSHSTGMGIWPNDWKELFEMHQKSS